MREKESHAPLAQELQVETRSRLMPWQSMEVIHSCNTYGFARAKEMNVERFCRRGIVKTEV
jgi:hypothetical protein